MARKKPMQEIVLKSRMSDFGYYAPAPASEERKEQMNRLTLLADEDPKGNVFPYRMRAPLAYRVGYTAQDKPFIDPSGGPFLTVGTNLKELAYDVKKDIVVFDITSTKENGYVVWLDYDNKPKDDNPV